VSALICGWALVPVLTVGWLMFGLGFWVGVWSQGIPLQNETSKKDHV